MRMVLSRQIRRLIITGDEIETSIWDAVSCDIVADPRRARFQAHKAEQSLQVAVHLIQPSRPDGWSSSTGIPMCSAGVMRAFALIRSLHLASSLNVYCQLPCAAAAYTGAQTRCRGNAQWPLADLGARGGLVAHLPAVSRLRDCLHHPVGPVG